MKPPAMAPAEGAVELSPAKGGVTLKIRVIPRASKSGFCGVMDGALKARVAAPPVDGAANQELERMLAKLFGVPKSAVTIVAGQASKIKKAQALGITVEQAADMLAALPRA